MLPLAGATPAPCFRLVARPGETCVAADDFFFIGFNLILWTKRRILEEHGVEFSGLLTATLAALRRKSGAGNRQSALYAPFRWRANDLANLV